MKLIPMISASIPEGLTFDDLILQPARFRANRARQLTRGEGEILRPGQRGEEKQNDEEHASSVKPFDF